LYDFRKRSPTSTASFAVNGLGTPDINICTFPFALSFRMQSPVVGTIDGETEGYRKNLSGSTLALFETTTPAVTAAATATTTAATTAIVTPAAAAAAEPIPAPTAPIAADAA